MTMTQGISTRGDKLNPTEKLMMMFFERKEALREEKNEEKLMQNLPSFGK